MAERELADIFREHNIIPQVLPSDISIPYNLHVQWPSVRLNKPGQRLDREAVQEKPTCTVVPRPDASNEDHVLLMVDPDLTKYNDTIFGQVRHWLVAKCSVDSNGQVQGGTEISPYVGPAPLPAHFVVGEDRPSRYTFLLCRQRSGAAPSTYDMEALKSEYEGDTGSFGGESQNIIDRMKFNTQKFVDANDLEVVAGTFMLVEGNAKSGTTNAALLGQGLAEKAAGK